MRLVISPSGNPMLIVKSADKAPLRFLRASGWEWAQVNAIRWDLEQVFGQSVFIAWDDG